MRLVLITMFSLFFALPTVWAGDSCYQSSEYEAEQVVRFQTQLMVIAMMCDPHSDAELYNDYQKFSKGNQTFIKESEKELISFFQRDKKKNSTKMLHTLRTNIANEMAQFASTQVPSRFCGKFESRIDEAVNLQPDDLTILVNGMGTDLPSSYPLCVAH